MDTQDATQAQLEIDRVVQMAQSGQTRADLSDDLIESILGKFKELISAIDLKYFLGGSGSAGIRDWASDRGLPIEESLAWSLKTLRQALEEIEDGLPILELHVFTASNGDQCLVLGNYSSNQSAGYAAETIGVYPDEESMEADLRERGIVGLDVSDEYLSSWIIKNDD